MTSSSLPSSPPPPPPASDRNPEPGVPEEYRLAIELQEKESDRYWNRSNILLLVHAAMISFYITVAGDDAWYPLVVPIEGVVLGLIWLAILHKGKKYVSRWGEVAMEVERQAQGPLLGSSTVRYPILQHYEKVKSAESVPRFPLFRKNTTTLMRYAVYSLIAFWVLAGGVEVVGQVWGSGSTDNPPSVERSEPTDPPSRD